MRRTLVIKSVGKTIGVQFKNWVSMKHIHLSYTSFPTRFRPFVKKGATFLVDINTDDCFDLTNWALKKNRSFKYRLYPTKGQDKWLTEATEFSTQVWNLAVNHLHENKKRTGKYLTYAGLDKLLTISRSQHGWWDTFPRFIYEKQLERIHKSVKAFFLGLKEKRKVSLPKRKKDNDTVSLDIRDGLFKVTGDHITINKKAIKINMHRPLPEGAKFKRAIFKKELGKWFVSIQIEEEWSNPPEQKTTGDRIGVDVGIRHFATLSTGEHITNERFFTKNEKHLAELQRLQALKKKGTYGYRRLAKLVAKVHRKIKKQRKYFHDVLSRRMVTEFSGVAVEDLNIANLMEKRKGKKIHLAKPIADVGWASWLDILEYKCLEEGVEFKKVPAAYTSQTCPQCGAVMKKELNEEVHDCSCGCRMDRDHAAAQVILNTAFSS